MIECACATGTFCSTVVEVPWLPEVTEVHVGVPKGVPLDARMCNRNVRNIRSNVTRRAFTGRVECAHARSEVPLGCDFICSQT